MVADEKIYLDQYDDGSPEAGNELSAHQFDELAMLVGRILFGFNSLESDLDRMIAEAVNGRGHQPGYTITAELTPVFTKKIAVFKGLYGPMVKYLERPELQQEFEALYGRLYKIKDIRNEVAHADWLGVYDTYEVRLKIAIDDGGPYAVRKIMSPVFLRQKIEEIEVATNAATIFIENFEDAMSKH